MFLANTLTRETRDKELGWDLQESGMVVMVVLNQSSDGHEDESVVDDWVATCLTDRSA